MKENKIVNEVINMSSLNKDLQKINSGLDMKVNMNDSAFQRILDKISNGDLYIGEAEYKNNKFIYIYP